MLQFVQNMITMIGLAVGIDYSLFIVSRFREERTRGVSVEESIATAGATATRAVFFSGITVILALAGLLIMPMNIFISFGLGTITVVIAGGARRAHPAARGPEHYGRQRQPPEHMDPRAAQTL